MLEETAPPDDLVRHFGRGKGMLDWAELGVGATQHGTIGKTGRATGDSLGDGLGHHVRLASFATETH